MKKFMEVKEVILGNILDCLNKTLKREPEAYALLMFIIFVKHSEL